MLCRLAPAALVALATWLSPAAGLAQTPSERFDIASSLMAEGDHQEAAQAMVALADEHPDAALADDALFAAAQLYEEKLGKPGKAAELYRRLIDRYADSRVALAAERRLTRIDEAIGPGGDGAEPLAEMNRILYEHPDRDEAESIRLMEQLIAEHDDWPGLPEALLWLGSAYDRAGRRAESLATYERIADRWPGSNEAFIAMLRAAEVAVALDRFDDAEAYLDRLDDDDRPGRAHSLRSAREMVEREQLRHRLYLASFAILALVLSALTAGLRWAHGSWRRAGRALLRPPVEVLYMAPVAVLLLISALTGHEMMAPAVGIILAGGLVLSWLFGAAMKGARKPPRWLLAAQTLVAVVGVLVICYVAVHRTRLIDLILSTVRFGPDV